MSNERRPPDQSRFALSIRARLMILAVVAILPLLIDRVRDIESDRTDRIDSASQQALSLAHQGMAAQNEAIIAARAFMQVTAGAHALMSTRGERCDNFLADAARSVTWLKSLSFVEPNGHIICSSNPDVVGVDISHLPHFKRATQTREFALSDYFVGRVVGPTLFAAMPHTGPDGAIDVLVSAPLELSWFDRVASTLAQSSGSVVLMVDGSGTLLARQPAREGLVGRQFKDRALIRAMLAQSEGVFTGESLDGVRRIFGFVQLPGTSARLAVGMDEGEVMRRANHEIMMGLAGLLLMTAVVLAAIWFGGERLFVRPIRTLTRIAQPAGTRVRETATPRAAVPPSFRNLVARDPDFTARFGGEEFAVLLQGASLEAAVAAADRLRSAVEDLRIAHETSPKGFVTISIGVASVVPSKGDTAQRLVETADAGLYEAKRRGRNMVVAHTSRALAQAS